MKFVTLFQWWAWHHLCVICCLWTIDHKHLKQHHTFNYMVLQSQYYNNSVHLHA